MPGSGDTPFGREDLYKPELEEVHIIRRHWLGFSGGAAIGRFFEGLHRAFSLRKSLHDPKTKNR